MSAGDRSQHRASSARLVTLRTLFDQERARLHTRKGWLRWLQIAARFADDSVTNHLLIAAQRPDATHLANYQAWPALGRHVLRGEKSLRLVLTRPGGDIADVAVFDLSQTDGTPLPAARTPPLGSQTQLVRDEIERLGFTVGVDTTSVLGDALSQTLWTERHVILNQHLDDTAVPTTMASELARIVLHQPPRPGPTQPEIDDLELRGFAYLVLAQIQPPDTIESPLGEWTEYTGLSDLDADLAAVAQRITAAARPVIRSLVQRIQPTTPDQHAAAAQLSAAARAGVQRTRRLAATASTPAASTPAAAALNAPAVDVERLLAAHTAAAVFYRNHLASDAGAGPRHYLASRDAAWAITDDRWALGYAPAQWDALRHHMNQTGFTDAELLQAGLIRATASGQLIDQFRDRIMFGIRDHTRTAGPVVGFIGRASEARGPDVPKYLNSPTTVIYDKSRLLFGLVEQRAPGSGPRTPVVVEGPFDVLAVARLAHEQPAYLGVGTCGTALTAQHAAALAAETGLGPRLITAFDPNPAGRAATERAFHTLLPAWEARGTDPRSTIFAAALPSGHDPGSLPLSELSAVLSGQVRPLDETVLDHQLDTWLGQHAGDHLSLEDRITALRHVVPLIAGRHQQDSVALMIHVQRRLDLLPDTVIGEVTDYQRDHQPTPATTPEPTDAEPAGRKPADTASPTPTGAHNDTGTGTDTEPPAAGPSTPRRRTREDNPNQPTLDFLWEPRPTEDNADERVREDGPRPLAEVAPTALPADPGPDDVLHRTGQPGGERYRGPDDGAGRGRPDGGGLPEQTGPAEHGEAAGEGEDPGRTGPAPTGTGSDAGRRAAGGRGDGPTRVTPEAEPAAESRPASSDPLSPPEPAPPSARQELSQFRPNDQDDLAPSGEVTRVRANLAALRIVRTLQHEQRPATADEQQVLARWSGWGAVPKVFDERDSEFDTFAWARTELAQLLSKEELDAAARNTLNAHYTDANLVAAIWDGITQLGFTGGRVLEPGCGSGTFLGMAPPSAQMVGVELEPITGAIARALYPQAQVRTESFADTRAARDTFDLAIGNVPFGRFTLTDKLHNPAGHSIHNHFIIKSLHLTRPGGLVAVVTSQSTMDADNPAARREIAGLADLVAAIRLPGGAHQRAAGTSVVTDLLILRRREPGTDPVGDAWEQTRALPDQPVAINEYFHTHPHYVLGEMSVGHGRHSSTDLVVTATEPTPQALCTALARVASDARDAGLTWQPAPGTSDRAEPVPLLDLDTGLQEGQIQAQPDGTFTQPTTVPWWRTRFRRARPRNCAASCGCATTSWRCSTPRTRPWKTPTGSTSCGQPSTATTTPTLLRTGPSTGSRGAAPAASMRIPARRSWPGSGHRWAGSASTRTPPRYSPWNTSTPPAKPRPRPTFSGTASSRHAHRGSGLTHPRTPWRSAWTRSARCDSRKSPACWAPTPTPPANAWASSSLTTPTPVGSCPQRNTCPATCEPN